MNLRLSDEVIAHVARLLQLSLLSGTDIVDHMRRITLTNVDEEGMLYLNEDYEKMYDKNVQRMVQEAMKLQNLETSVDEVDE